MRVHADPIIGIREEEVAKLVYTLFWCKPVFYPLVQKRVDHCIKSSSSSL